MSSDPLMHRRQQLLTRSNQLRISLASQVRRLERPLDWSNSAQNGLRWACRNPVWPFGALLTLVILRPRRTFIWAGRLWTAWRELQKTNKQAE